MKPGKCARLIEGVTKRARVSFDALCTVKGSSINTALRRVADFLKKEQGTVFSENERDCREAGKRGLAPAMIDRLRITEKTMQSMIRGLRDVAGLPCSVGTTFDARTRPNGLRICKIRVPIGVIGIIYESRPNVTIDAAALCLKSRNAVILRGGSEAIHSNTVLAHIFRKALEKSGLAPDAVQCIETTDREAIRELCIRDDRVDCIIPRGGEGLIRAVVELSRVPVIKHYKGVCHVYVSRHASRETAIPLVVNAKVQRPGVCNAMETLLLDAGLGKNRKKEILEALMHQRVVLYGDEPTRALVSGIKKATKADWEAEYLSLRCAVRQVAGVREAAAHINLYGSHHTDAIVSNKVSEIEMFRKLVDSSSIMINASTRFSDGGEYGLGCEIGISTDKLHARGPMGVDELTTYKWIVEGTGHIRE